VTCVAGALADPGEKMTIEQALSASYRPVELGGELGSSSRIYWVKMVIHRTGDPKAQWILRFNNGWDYVDLNIPRAAGFDHDHSGDRVSPAQRPIRSHTIAFPLSLPSEGDLTLYARLEGDARLSGEARRLGVSLARSESFIGETRRFNYLQGIWAGIMLAMVGYNFALFLGLRERTYLFYSLYVLSFGLVWAQRANFLFEYLWPNSTQWNFDNSFYFVGATVFFSAVFVRSFLNTGKGPKAIDMALWAILIATPAIVLTGMIRTPAVIAPILAWAALGTTAFYWVLGLTMLMRGFAPARFFLLGCSVLIATSIFYILIFLGILHSSPYVAEDAVQVGSAVECILLAFALADRVKVMKAEHEAQQLRYTAELKTAVEQRTRELVDLNSRLEATSITDHLTGLRNRRSIDTMIERLTAEIKRSRHGGDQESLAICLADLDHFKKVNDDYGHEGGDNALKAVASSLSGATRGSTVLARWGGEEFLVVDRVHRPEEGAAFAERLRHWIAETVRVQVPNGEVRMTMSVGLAHYPFARAFPDLLSWQEVLILADHGLYKAKQSGRNCCFLVRAKEEELQAYIRNFGFNAASNLCRRRISEAVEAGLIEVVATKTVSFSIDC
jgi:diguanylate cyclase (GGDEF)-like protein